MSTPTLLIWLSLVLAPGLAWSEGGGPEPPDGLGSGSGYDISAGIVRASERYLGRLIEAEGSNIQLVFPGRSMTVLSILAEQAGIPTLNIAGSGLTESLTPEKWADPTSRPKLELYRSLVESRVAGAIQANPNRKMVVVDMADTGESILRFEALLREVLQKQKKATELQSYFLRDFRMPPGVADRLKENGIAELTIPVPMDTSKVELTESQSQAWMDRFYRHQDDAIAFSGTAGNVSSFEILDVDPSDPESVSRYKKRFSEEGGEQNRMLRRYLKAFQRAGTPTGESCQALYPKLN